MSTQCIEDAVPATAASPRGALRVIVVSLEAAVLATAHGVWEFLKAASEVRVRRDMLTMANDVAATQPELAARLRRAARESWAE